VPQPEWYFEADDNLHRQGLDLLMMTQGWRRFNWQDMAVSGRWEIEQPAEKYQILRGRVTKNTDRYDEIVEDLTGNATDSNGEDRHDEVPDEAQLPPKARAKTEQHDHFRFGSLKREVLVHAELVSLENFDRAICEDVTSDNGRFSLVIPHFKGKCIFFLAASDSTKWRRDRRYEWVRMIPSESDRFEKLRYNWKFRDKDPQPLRVTLDFPYPRFVRPYHYYHTIPAPQPEWDSGQAALNDGARLLKEVGVNARRNGLRRFSDANPAFSIDAYEGYNFAYDAGVKITMSMHKRVAENIARAYIGDMGLDYPYYHFTDFKFDKPTEYPSQSGIRLRYGPTYLRRTMGDMTANQDSLYLRGSLSSIPEDGASMPPKELEWNYGFSKIDRYVIYTDYIPRMEGDKRYEGSNLPETNVVLYPFPDGGERVTYRDRRLILPGFSVPVSFYHPDYSKRPLPDVKDYRRTLYWNPDLKLDDKGRATIQFYNNSQQTRLSVSADGMTENGQLLTGTNISYE
ncbi:MAG: hypothetical protein IKR98_07155, partial [Bacteroidaceae bacterium]|nr:hypothetical protein [Bacteroidaceae bacterium]